MFPLQFALMRSPLRRLFGAISRALPVIALVAALPAMSQVPTPEQLQMFQTLSPEQQQAILQSIGGGQLGGGGSQVEGVGTTGAVSGESPQDRLRRQAGLGGQSNLNPALKPDDVVIVEVAFPRTIEDRAREAAMLRPAGQQALTGGIVAPAEPAEVPASLLQRARNSSPLTDADKARLQPLINLILSRNPYTLDSGGVLNLPGFAPISLNGLSEDQATQRLGAEPTLLELDVRIVRLPVLRSGPIGLKPFGYDLFEGAPSTFAPLTNAPVPADYVIGPGDELSVQLYGSQNRTLRLPVNRDGTVTFPELGPIAVAGLRFGEARTRIENRVSQQMIGVNANVSMGEMRSIRIFVLGEARQPGNYAVSGLATMTTALFASGGVKPIGSLRNIQLKRQGRVVGNLDLYDLLIRGDTSGDAALQPGDVIFIPPAGPTAAVEGEVRRPAIYELKGNTDTAGLLEMAGGLTPQADQTRASLTRVDEQSRRVVLATDLTRPEGNALPLRNGDSLWVARLRPQVDAGVQLEGFVYRPGPVPWRDGMRLTDVIGSIDELKPEADSHYVLIRRERDPDRRVEVLSADLSAALAARGSPADVTLTPRDRIIVFELAPGRARVIRPIVEELRVQSGLARPTELVRIEGRVKVPGEYPLEPDMKISDLLRAGGNLDSAAFGGKAELARYEVDGVGTRQTELLDINLAGVLQGDPAADVILRPFDYLLIKETPNWTDQESVTILGEVQFPGTYPIRKGETLRQLLDRVGGLTATAFPQGSIFLREELREREQTQLNLLRERLRSDMATMAVRAAAANQGGAIQAVTSGGDTLLNQLQSVEAVGRLVIDLPSLVAASAGSEDDIVLRNGDRLLVPKFKQEVTVIGEVQTTTSHLYATSLGADDYIAMSGGTTQKADRKRTYVVRADGSVARQRSSFLSRRQAAIQPGDTIVVPFDTERMPPLPLWTAVTSILYNLAVSVAAVNSF
jgi:protein involved in polysaccharide export with SLBB domain